MTPPSQRRSPLITSDTGPCAIVPLWLIESDVSDRALRVYALIAAKWADRDDRAWPSRQTIGSALPMPSSARARRPERPDRRGAVDRAIADLERVGAITVERQERALGQEYETNTYKLHRVRRGSHAAAATPDPAPAATSPHARSTEPDPSKPEAPPSEAASAADGARQIVAAYAEGRSVSGLDACDAKGRAILGRHAKTYLERAPDARIASAPWYDAARFRESLISEAVGAARDAGEQGRNPGFLIDWLSEHARARHTALKGLAARGPRRGGELRQLRVAS